jgi:hypothetical protein
MLHQMLVQVLAPMEDSTLLQMVTLLLPKSIGSRSLVMILNRLCFRYKSIQVARLHLALVRHLLERLQVT